MDLPKLKSTISSFMLGEEGKMSKQSALVLGSMFMGTSLGILASNAHAATTCDIEYVEPGTEVGRCVHSSSGACGENEPVACGGCDGGGM